MTNDINILKDFLFALVKEQTLTAHDSIEYKKRQKTISELKKIIEKSENRILTSKKIMN